MFAFVTIIIILYISVSLSPSLCLFSISNALLACSFCTGYTNKHTKNFIKVVLVLLFMSSEESGEDESEQPWRHPQINKFLRWHGSPYI